MAFPFDTKTGPQRSTLPQLPRPHKEPTGRGMIVKLEKIAGLTPAGILDTPFTFQVPPINTFPINRSYPQTMYDTIAGEQRMRPGIVQLPTVSYDTMFTEDPYAWTLLHGDGFLPNPIRMLAQLAKIGENQAYFWLTARTPTFYNGYDVNWVAALTDLNSEIRDGEPEARYVTVGFTRFKESALSTRTVGGSSTKSAGLPVSLRADQLPAGRTTLRDLSVYYYGNSGDWKRIAKANNLDQPASVDLRPLGHRKIVVPKKA